MSERPSKSVLRVRAAETIAALSAPLRVVADSEIAARLLDLPEVRRASQFLAYLALPDEPCLRIVLHQAVAAGMRVFAPRMDTSTHMSFVRWSPSDGDAAAPGGKWNPSSDEGPVPAPTVAFVPGRAFDLEGFRLGRGLGCYDRALSALRGFATFVGVAYECQLMQRLPREPHDERVDMVVTERRTLRFR